MQAAHDLAGAGRNESRSKWQRPWRCWNGTPGVTTCCRCHMGTGRDGQLHNCDSTTMRWCWGDWPAVCILLGMQRFSRVEQVTGIEPALSAWELLKLMGMCLVPCEFRGHERSGVSFGRLP